jgi:hypothetical protein
MIRSITLEAYNSSFENRVTTLEYVSKAFMDLTPSQEVKENLEAFAKGVPCTALHNPGQPVLGFPLKKRFFREHRSAFSLQHKNHKNNYFADCRWLTGPSGKA